MLLRRSLFVLDISVLLAIVVFLVFLPAERCAHFKAKETPSDSKCNIHPVHHPDFSFTSSAKSHMANPQHLVSICHNLQWSDFAFWENAYLIFLPAIVGLILVAFTLSEAFDFQVFAGQLKSTSIILLSLFAIFYTIGVIIFEKNRVRNAWPFVRYVQDLGAEDSSIHVTVPSTWQYSIALCILSALFKIGRLLIQHFLGDKKFYMDDQSQHHEKVPTSEETPQSNVPGVSTSGILNASAYSKIESD